MIYPTFMEINWLFGHLLKNWDDDPARDSFDKYYLPLVEIKNFYVLINNKPFFFEQTAKKQAAYEKLVEIPRSNDYTAENIL